MSRKVNHCQGLCLRQNSETQKWMPAQQNLREIEEIKDHKNKSKQMLNCRTRELGWEISISVLLSGLVI